MQELGVDLADAYTKPVAHDVIAGADVVVTMGRSVGQVEIPPGVRQADGRVGDPASRAAWSFR
jgi:arsenate reductase